MGILLHSERFNMSNISLTNILDELHNDYFDQLESEGVEFVEYEDRGDGQLAGFVSENYACTSDEEKAAYLGYESLVEYIQEKQEELQISQKGFGRPVSTFLTGFNYETTN